MTKSLIAVATAGAIVATLAANLAVAQPKQMAPIATPPATATPPAAPPAATAAAPDTKKVASATTTRTHRWLKADARVCLEFPNELQVIKCSENYR